MHEGHSGLPHGIPDLCALDPTAEDVQVGTTRTITGPVTISGICVEGELTLAGQGVSVSNIQVHDTGSLIFADGLELIIRDTPIDPIIDPEGFGTGLIVFGKWRAAGQLRTAKVRLAQEVLGGATTLLLENAPAGWAAGHVLALPDSRQRSAAMPSWSEEVTIASISGTTVTLTAPTKWPHLGGRRPDGTLRFLPHVANLSRSIVVRSQNPAGTRGHILANGRADVDVRYVEFRDMGRTTADPLDSTKFDAAGLPNHIGTNQIGRYPLHWHHVFGPVVPQPNGKQWTTEGLSIHSFKKWGYAVHNTHFGESRDDVIWNGDGAGIVTEDGSETGNQFIRPFMAHIFNTTWVMGPADENQALTDPQMRRGSGFVFRSPSSDIIGAVVADTREGLNYLTQSAEENDNPSSGFPYVRIPNAPGLDTTIDANVTTIQIYKRARGRNEDCEVYGCNEIGVGTWVAANAGIQKSPPITRMTIWHTSPEGNAWFGKYTDIEFVDLEMLNEGGLGNAYGQFNPATAMTEFGTLAASQFLRADIRGFATGWTRQGQIGQAGEWVVLDSTFQNRTDFLITNDGEYSAGSAYTPDGVQRPRFSWQNVRFLPIPNQAHLGIDAHYKVLGTDPPMRREFELKIVDYQGIAADNFRLWFEQPPGLEESPCRAHRPEIIGFCCPLDAPPILPPPPVVQPPIIVPPPVIEPPIVIPPPVVTPPQTWTGRVEKTVMTYPNGEKRVIVRLPNSAPFLLNDVVVVTKPNG